MHSLLALVDYRRTVKGEGYGLVTIAERVRIRRRSINREISWIDGVLDHRIRQVDYKVRWLSGHHTATGWISSGHSETYKLPIGEGILLGGAVDGYAPVRPRSDMPSQDRRAVVVVACIRGLDPRVRLRRERTDYIR